MVCYLAEIQFIIDEKPPKRSTLPTQKVNTFHLKSQHFPPKKSTLPTQKVNIFHLKGQHFDWKSSRESWFFGWNPAKMPSFSDEKPV